MTINSLQSLTNPLLITEQFHQSYVIVTKKNQETQIDELTYEKRNKAIESSLVEIISAIAAQILKIGETTGDPLFKAIQDPTTRKQAKRYINHLYKVSTLILSQITIPIVEYDRESLIFQALKILRKCDQKSKFSTIQLAVLEERSPHANQDQTNTKIVSAHCEYSSIFPQFLESIKPFIQCIQREIFVLNAIRKAGLSVASFYSLMDIHKENPLLFLEETTGSAGLSEQNKKFHELIKRAFRHWDYTCQTLNDLKRSLHIEIDESKIALPLDEPKIKLLKAYYLLADYWLHKANIPQNTPLTSLPLHKNITNFNTLYHSKRIGEMYSFEVLLQFIVNPRSLMENVERIKTLARLSFSWLTMLKKTTKNSLPLLDEKVLAILREQNPFKLKWVVNDLAKSLRMLIAETFNLDNLLKWINKELSPSKNTIYRNLYDYRMRNGCCSELPDPQVRIKRIKNVQRDLRLTHPNIEKLFSKEEIEMTILPQKMAKLSLISDEPREKTRYRKGAHEHKKKKKTVATVASSSTSTSEIIELGSQDIASSTYLQPERITYSWRVLKWRALGRRIFDIDPNYKNLPPEEHDEMIFRHTLFDEIDSYIDSVFTHFTVNTPSGKRLCYTAPAELYFKEKSSFGFVEYAFELKQEENGSERRGECFHLYFSKNKHSLSNDLARQSYLEKDPEQIQEEALGTWNIQGSQTKIEEDEKKIVFHNEKEDIKLTLFR